MTSPQRPRAAATPTASPEGVTAERDDLITRLRRVAQKWGAEEGPQEGRLQIADEAADELLAARQEIERLTRERDEARAHHEYFAIESVNRKYALAAQAQRSGAQAMSVKKEWHLHLDITTDKRAEAKLLQSLIFDVLDKRKFRRVSTIISGTRRYRRREA